METADWVALIIGIAGVAAGVLGALPVTAKKPRIALWITCGVLVLAAGQVAVNKDGDDPVRSLEPGDVVDLTCTLDPPTPRPGTTATLTYTFTSKRRGLADLGADVYDADANTFGDGFGDRQGHLVAEGANTVSRPVRVPASLMPGDYEITGEIWQNGKAGAPGSDTIDDATCGAVTVK